MSRRANLSPVAASIPTTAPPSGGDWIPVTTDGAWWWDGQRWETTVRSPWPAQPALVVAPPASQRRPRSAAGLLAALILLPLRVAWFLLRPVLAMAAGLAAVLGVLVVAAVLLAHALH